MPMMGEHAFDLSRLTKAAAWLFVFLTVGNLVLAEGIFGPVFADLFQMSARSAWWSAFGLLTVSAFAVSACFAVLDSSATARADCHRSQAGKPQRRTAEETE